MKESRPGFIGHARILSERRVSVPAGTLNAANRAARDESAERGSRHKYKAVPTTVDGIRFDSKREAERYLELRMLERGGAIRDLELQPVYRFSIEGKAEIRYVADFRYIEIATGAEVVEDVKGYRTREYKFKRGLMQKCRGIVIREIE